MGVCMFLIYPSVLLVLFQSIHCVDSFAQLDSGDFYDVKASRLWANPEIMCESDRFDKYYKAVSIPAIIAWLFVLPIAYIVTKS